MMRRDYGYDANGRRRPGVTDVIGETLGWSSEPLRQWATGLAVDRAMAALGRGVDPADARQIAMRAPDGARDSAAALGTVVHALVEAGVGGSPSITGELVAPSDLARAFSCSARVLSWLGTSGYRVMHSELAIVDEQNAFGGTMDLVLTDGERAIVADLKTGKSVRRKPEIVIQLGGYAMLLRGRGILVAGGLVIHAPIDGEVSIVEVPREAIAAGEAAFACLLTVHNMRALFASTMKGERP